MRAAIIALSTFAAIVSTAVATEAPNSGAYVALTTRDAAACARACADDGICMVWSFHRENQCQLSAVVPSSADPLALASGYASRAPAFLHARIPVVDVAAAIELAPTPLTEISHSARVALQTSQDDGLLLGGPEEGDLRLGLR